METETPFVGRLLSNPVGTVPDSELIEDFVEAIYRRLPDALFRPWLLLHGMGINALALEPVQTLVIDPDRDEIRFASRRARNDGAPMYLGAATILMRREGFAVQAEHRADCTMALALPRSEIERAGFSFARLAKLQRFVRLDTIERRLAAVSKVAAYKT